MSTSRRPTKRHDRLAAPITEILSTTRLSTFPSQTGAVLHDAAPAPAIHHRVTTPALVIHGEADPVFQLPAGRATAAALPNAELLVLPGMGRNLPRGIWPTLVAAVSRLADRADALPTSTVTG